MKLIILLFFITLNTFAQVTFKSEYFAKDKLSRQRLSVQLPLSLQKYEDDPYQRMKNMGYQYRCLFYEST